MAGHEEHAKAAVLCADLLREIVPDDRKVHLVQQLVADERCEHARLELVEPELFLLALEKRMAPFLEVRETGHAHVREVGELGLLEQALFAPSLPARIEVVNVSVGGYNAYNETKLLEGVGQSYEPDLVLELEQKNYNVFFVEDAIGSPYIPAQDDFVVPYGVRSVLGFGGLMPSGQVFAALLFTTSGPV